MNYKEKLDKWRKASDQEAAIDYPTTSDMEYIFKYAEALFTFAKFKEGDLVEIAENYPVSIGETPGWWSIRHLLKKGSKATIQSVDWYDGRFVYLIEFDEGDTWIDDRGVIQACKYSSGKTNISISERWLAPRATEVSAKKSLLKKNLFK